MASFIAAGTAYATHGINTIPFFIFYSMFGFQRIADFIWAAADMRVRGFLLGGTSGRTTLAGEGLQHQDGNSHVLALTVPNLRAYDPAYAYELAVIIQDGIRRMYKDGESIFYYITVMNEPYAMPEMPDGASEGILKGMYKFRASSNKKSKLRAQLFGSGAILNEALQAQEILEKKYGRLERHQLQSSLHRRSRDRPLEPPASGGKAARPLCDGNAEGFAGSSRRRHRLLEDFAAYDQLLASAPNRLTRHRRVRPQRRPHLVARFL
jgi:pyruvate dehydrogenase complex dehydrogenase (E1) component